MKKIFYDSFLKILSQNKVLNIFLKQKSFNFNNKETSVGLKTQIYHTKMINQQILAWLIMNIFVT